MLQQEFEERTGLKVTPEEYHEIEKMYNTASEQIDKDTFCNDWMRHKDSLLLKDMFEMLLGIKERIKEYQKERELIANFLLSEANQTGNPVLDSEAVVLIGRAEVIRRKIEFGYTLTEDDKCYIKCNLK